MLDGNVGRRGMLAAVKLAKSPATHYLPCAGRGGAVLSWLAVDAGSQSYTSMFSVELK